MNLGSNLNLGITLLSLVLVFTVTRAASYSQDVWELEWTDAEDSTDFVFRTKLTTGDNVWSAFALSKDQQMGDDDVAICTSTTVEHLHNSGKSAPVAIHTDRQIGFSNIKTTYQNGVLECSFKRVKSITNEPKHFSVTERTYFVLFAHGSAFDGKYSYHSSRMTSNKEFDFNARVQTLTTEDVLTTTERPLLTSETPTKPTGTYSQDVWELEWTDAEDSTDFVFRTKLTTGDNVWSAFALSKDQQMGDDDVAICTSTTVEHLHNSGKSAPVAIHTDRQIGFSNIKTTYQNGVLECSFKRVKSITNEPKHFSVTERTYFVLFAHGSAFDGKYSYHSSRMTSNKEFDFGVIATTSEHGDTTTTEIKTTLTSTQASTTTTATSAAVYIVEDFELRWVNKELTTDFVFRTKVPAHYWTAFAFSYDKSMGNDDVAICTSTTVEHLHNSGKSAPVAIHTDRQIGFSNIKTTYQNGVLECSFTRVKTLSNVENYFNLKDTKYYILNAHGPASGARSARVSYAFHNKKFTSGTAISLETGDVPSAAANREDLVKAHALLMIISWLGFAATGMLFARYYKYVYRGLSVREVAVWFFTHRFLMVLLLITSSIAALLIFIYKDWAWIKPGSTNNFAHSIIGILAYCLAFFQPFMAFFRPDKESKMRPFFNWFHRLLGVLVFLLALVAIFLGVAIYFKNFSGMGVLIGWTVWLLFLPILLEIIDLLIHRKLSESGVKEIDYGDKQAMRPVKLHELFKSFLMVAHILVSIVFVVVFIVLVSVVAQNSAI